MPKRRQGDSDIFASLTPNSQGPRADCPDVRVPVLEFVSQRGYGSWPEFEHQGTNTIFVEIMLRDVRKEAP